MFLAYFFAQKVNEILSDNVYVKYIAAVVFITMGIVSILTRDKPKKKKQIDIDEVLNEEEVAGSRFAKVGGIMGMLGLLIVVVTQLMNLEKELYILGGILFLFFFKFS